MLLPDQPAAARLKIPAFASMLGCTQSKHVLTRRSAMTQSKSGGNQTNKQSDNMSEEDLAKQRAGKSDKSSHDHMSRQ
jgi:hypothetical protein